MDAPLAGTAGLKDIILDRVRRKGPLSFRDFMALALYEPRYGYYRSQDPSRDYETSPQLHPVFGATLGRQLAEIWRRLGGPDRFLVFEDGAGDCRLAAAILDWVRREDADFYGALAYEVRDLDVDALARRAAAVDVEPGKLRARADWPEAVEGCILTNELLDALPVHRVRVEGGRLQEIYCDAEDDRLVDLPQPPSEAVSRYFAALGLLPGEGCEAEVNLAAVDWLERAAAVLRRGYLLTLDYGYPAAALYAPWRRKGTLLTFYRHSAGEDPYLRVGEQDITASVDFTTLTRAGEAAGLHTLGLTSQAEFLAALGIGVPLFERPRPDALAAYYGLRRAIVELTDAAGLGRISVLVQSKDVPAPSLTGLGAVSRG